MTDDERDYADEMQRIRALIKQMRFLRTHTKSFHRWKRCHSVQRHRGCRGDSY